MNLDKDDTVWWISRAVGRPYLTVLYASQVSQCPQRAWRTMGRTRKNATGWLTDTLLETLLQHRNAFHQTALILQTNFEATFHSRRPISSCRFYARRDSIIKVLRFRSKIELRESGKWWKERKCVSAGPFSPRKIKMRASKSAKAALSSVSSSRWL